MAPFRLELPVLVQRGGRLVAEGTRPFAVDQTVQTLNIADFCNECGNCTTFCPTAGAPYRDKPRFWIDREGFQEAPRTTPSAWSGARSGLVLEARLGGQVTGWNWTAGRPGYPDAQVSVRLEAGTWRVLGWEAQAVLPEGSTVDLGPCATLLVLTRVESALPELVSMQR